MAFEDIYGDGGEDAANGEAQTWPGLSVGEQAALAMAPKVGDSSSSAGGGGGGWRDVIGKIWNAPNTALGLA
jgi:hypothetical protein